MVVWLPILASILVTEVLRMSLLKTLLITCGVGLIAVPLAFSIFPPSKVNKEHDDTAAP